MTNLPQQPTFFEAQQWASFCLKAAKLPTDAGRFLLLGLSQFDQTQLLVHYRDLVPLELWAKFQVATQRVVAGEPAQYVLGTAPFYGLTFKVTPAVLIPRVETEELVDWVLTDLVTTPTATVLDIGTGSGAIALSLKHERPTWQLTASDISAAALSVARENAARLKLAVSFVASDLFAQLGSQNFDVIVSNPPYIATDEKAVMDASVLNYEPHQALFAEHAGLAIYEQLAQQVASHLTPHGRLYLEFGYHQGAAIQQLFTKALPTAHVTLRQDMAGHDRMLRVIL
ncbi:peptide chain release factor N(5)-glutamine methyltransferase [Lactiplantibacillus nangangensis]|uniref:Release factor glutamine methyltransferase n=1 Tax=Lactiplantibacillus nangangensis TaxID=2559917 RepID=A0ABW1SL33_9LACO|nr:peptide chain release factor N(5)-glutamine methyltransferase [Lactiplantibacillus nangangensis]